jgi:hypothetical protein
MIFYCSIFLFGGYYTLNDRTCHQPPWCALVPGNQVLTIVMVSQNHRLQRCWNHNSLKFQQLYTMEPNQAPGTTNQHLPTSFLGDFHLRFNHFRNIKTHRLFSLSLLQPHGPSHYLSMATSFAKGYPPLIQRSPGTSTYIHHQWRFIAGEII